MNEALSEGLVREVSILSEMYQVDLGNCNDVFDWWEQLISRFDLEDTELMLSIFQKPPVHLGSTRFIQTLRNHEQKLRSLLH